MLSVPDSPLALLLSVAGVALVGGSLRMWKFCWPGAGEMNAAGIAKPRLAFWPTEQQATTPSSVVTRNGVYNGWVPDRESLFIRSGDAPTSAFAVPNCAMPLTVTPTWRMPKARNRKVSRLAAIVTFIPWATLPPGMIGRLLTSLAKAAPVLSTQTIVMVSGAEAPFRLAKRMAVLRWAV